MDLFMGGHSHNLQFKIHTENKDNSLTNFKYLNGPQKCRCGGYITFEEKEDKLFRALFQSKQVLRIKVNTESFKIDPISDPKNNLKPEKEIALELYFEILRSNCSTNSHIKYFVKNFFY